MIRDRFNSVLDSLVRPQVQVFRRSWSTFHICGITGIVLGGLLAIILVIRQGLSTGMMGGIVLVAVSILFGLTMLTKLITGEEKIINYHHQIAVLATTSGLLWLLGQPVLPYLDATMLGVGLFIAFGRIGCLMNGCCHGHPGRWGVCYDEEHIAVGFTRYYVRIRLVPVQAMESLWLFMTVLVGSSLILTGHAPGEALAWYLVLYAVGRFGFEFLRGDPTRPYYGGFSEAQWISLFVGAGVAGAGWANALPLQPGHLIAAAGLALTMIAVALYRRFRKPAKHRLLHANHVRDFAHMMEHLAHAASARTTPHDQHGVSPAIALGCTALGIQLSTSELEDTDGRIYHYTLSARNTLLSQEAARVLAALILQLKHPSSSYELIPANQGLFHVLIHPQKVRHHHDHVPAFSSLA